MFLSEHKLEMLALLIHAAVSAIPMDFLKYLNVLLCLGYAINIRRIYMSIR